MLKHRLFFGIIMSLFIVGIVIFDAYIDGSLTGTAADDKNVQGTIFCILVALLAIPANLELDRLAAAKHVKIFLPVTIASSVLLAISRYIDQIILIRPENYLVFVLIFAFFGIILFQYLRFGISSILSNCGANYFAILYLGLLSSFCIAIRIEYGIWPLLMYIFVVKAADIGAYTAGNLFGKHKFSPRISPGKTWEGMAGGAISSILVAIGFAASCGIMYWLKAFVFGLCLAFIGQIGDLIESMIKRDAQQKDSANKVPGFGGVLDIIDSPLATAPFAYLFFMWGS